MLSQYEYSYDPDEHQGIQALPLSERPYEKLRTQGLDSLSNAELLAILLCSGGKGKSTLDLARELLSCGRGLHYLDRAPIETVAQLVTGVGMVKGMRVKAAFELGRRLEQERNTAELTEISSAQAAKDWFRPILSHLGHEELHAVFLDNGNHVLKSKRLASGGSAGAALAPRDLFSQALAVQASGLILAHNHPSGVSKPSQEDLDFTRNLIRAGSVLSIRVLDHIICTPQGEISMREEGQL